MPEQEQLTADSLTLVPDSDGERLQSAFSSILRNNGVISRISEGYTISERTVFDDIGRLGLFSFYYESWSGQGDLTHVILDEDLIASIWCTDTDDAATPYGRGKVRNPLIHLGHAYGNCSVCPAKSLLGYNSAHSSFSFTLEEGRREIDTPETAEYAKEATSEACENCQEYMSSWFSEKVREDPDYLWMLGGCGLLHRIPTDYTIPGEFEDYDILELATGSDPPSEIETDDDFIASHDGRMDSHGLDNEGEFLFNATLAFQLHVDFDFDDIKLSCSCEEPVKMVHELDIVLSDFENQQIVVIETTSENEINSSKLRNKHNVILQLHALQNRYEELDIQYIYLTTGAYPDDLHEDSATLDAQENLSDLGISVEVISRSDNISQTDLDPNALNHHGSKEFIENFSSLYEGLLSECREEVERFMI